ncbi:MAG TPA: hypothetical protein DIT01_08930 [Lentisphaeria bacterium]|nr:hypothetical protein [Lentisphaeria bacterium]
MVDRKCTAADRDCPGYHLVPTSGWMGDPNGIIFHDGRYHVFYQHNPNDMWLGNPAWDRMDNVPWGPAANPNVPKGLWGLHCGDVCWGHAVSEDLVNWQHWPIAISATPGGYDAGGCFSGCTVINDGVPTIVYTSTTRTPAAGIRTLRAQSIATSDDGMVTWQKHPSNPVLADVPDLSGAIHAWHDPHVWQEEDGWYMALGCGCPNVAGVILLYHSADLLNWQYMHPLYVSGAIEKSGDRWLVPDFFKLGDKHVLLFCTGTPDAACFTGYAVGDYVDHCFIPEVEGVLGPGSAPSAMAARTLLDDQGRRIVFCQLGDERGDVNQRQAPRTGVLSLPWELSLLDDLTLGVQPVDEVCSKHQPDWQFENVTLAPGKTWRADSVAGDMLELVAEINVGQADEVALGVRCSNDGREQTLIVYNRLEQKLSVDPSHSSTDEGSCEESCGSVLKLAGNEPLRLHVFVDRSTVEGFANGRACVFHRIRPLLEDSVNVELVARGGEAEVTTLNAWRKEAVKITGLDN